MDSELASLAMVAASAVVNSLATEAWEKVTTGVGVLWRRVHPQRAETVRDELVETRQEVLAARQAGDEPAEQALIDEWGGRLRRLLAANPAVAAELRALLDDVLAPALAQAGAQPTVITMHAAAWDRGRVYQAGRDQHITER